MNNKIKHSGIVDKIESDSVQVRILQTSACAACKVAGHCNASESKEKVVDVYHADTSKMKVGDTVTVVASATAAAHALLFAFGLPFVLLVGVVYILLQLTGDEAVAALSGIASLVPYYIIVWLFKERLREKIAFSIEY